VTRLPDPAVLLAPAWGALVALPLVVAARRVAGADRTRALGIRRPSRVRARVVALVPPRLHVVAAAITSRRSARRDASELARELPLAVDLLQVAVSAGATPHRAVELATRWGPRRVGAALDSVLGSTRVGGSLGDALEALGRARPALEPVTGVLVASERLGAPAGPALVRVAQELRADLRRQAEARARTLPVKLLFPLVFLVLPAFGLLTVAPALLQALART
jgi:tight adherence protein C